VLDQSNTPRRRSLSVHGRTLSYLDYPGYGPALLMLHGVGSSAEGWQEAAAHFHANGARVICVDLPGHGSSSKEPGDYSLGSLASSVRDLIEHLDIGPVVLVGHSLGGGIALQFHYQFPSHVAGLVLVSSGGLGRETNLALRLASLPGSGVVLATAFNRATYRAIDATRRGVARMRRTRAADEGFLERFQWLTVADYRDTFLSTLRSVVDFSGQRVSALEKLHLTRGVPVLIVWGSDDPIIPHTHGQLAHSMLDNSEFVVFDGDGHEPHRSDPRRLYETVNGWQRRHGLATTDLDNSWNELLGAMDSGGQQ